MTFSSAARVTISPRVLFRELDGEAVLLDLQSERYYGLDDVGTRMWSLLSEHGDVRVVYERLLSEYQVDGTVLERDLARMIGELARFGMLTVEGDVPQDPTVPQI
jgi:hypothetical protein